MIKINLSENGKNSMPMIGEIFRLLSSAYLSRHKLLKNKLKSLPPKGSVIKKKIRGEFYFYLAYREGDRIKFDYIGTKSPDALIRKIAMRRSVIKEIHGVDDALFSLGVKTKKRRVGLSMRFQILSRDKFSCRYCGRGVIKDDVRLQVDHIIPIKRGGTGDADNLVTSCYECNFGKGKHLIGSIPKKTRNRCLPFPENK